MTSTNTFRAEKAVPQQGFSLLEFLIAMVVLTIGVGGLLPLLLASITLDKKAAGDTTAVMVAEVVLEQMSSAGSNFTGVLPNPLQDCAAPPNSWNIDMTSNPAGGLGTGSGGPNGGNGANLTNQGAIDWTQDYATIPAGYAMRYVACSTTNDTPVTYEVRWDVIRTSSSDSTKMVVVSARPMIQQAWSLGVIAPINMRSIIGM
ncbi:MAG TPA: prepilin-type N-terminal cleavage/methylation domain-containing protein [Candidatus Sulfotelmatobacter sp.]|nr:prepilin-type N-terminal cleavage/methylation domain-containing protein [Candidatus Sulfotelmatobacter sp.]